MIDVSWGHLVVIAVVALIVIGPKELPTVLRTAGQWMGKIRRMASEFQGQFQEALREAEMTDLKQHFDDISSAAKSFDPISTIRKEVEAAVADKPIPTTEAAAGSTSAPAAPLAETPPPQPMPPVEQTAAAVPAVPEITAEPLPKPPAPRHAGGRAE